MYKAYPYKDKFFDSKQSKEIGNFDKLAGCDLTPGTDYSGKIGTGDSTILGNPPCLISGNYVQNTYCILRCHME